MALQLDKAARLSVYQYLGCVLQLMYDVFIFNQHFSMLQGLGIGIIFFTGASYALLEFKKAQSDEHPTVCTEQKNEGERI